MRLDLTVTGYATYDDLARYMWGSAAVIGLEMLPILGRADDSVRVGRNSRCARSTWLRVPADQLHPRRRRGPATRAGVPAAGVASTSSASTATGCAGAGWTSRSATCSRGRSNGPARSTAAPSRASSWCTDLARLPAHRADACTRGSSTRSSEPTTTCSRAGSRSAWCVAARSGSPGCGTPLRARRATPRPTA